MPTTPDWSPERLKRLDRMVAETEGWTDIQHTASWARDWGTTSGGDTTHIPRYSLGEGLWELMEREVIEVFWDRKPCWMAWAFADHRQSVGPTIPIAVCLVLLAKAGKKFE